MAMTKRNGKNDTIILNTIEGLVPQDHEVRKLESCIDWSFIYPLVKDLYSDFGRPSIDPVVLFKMLFINIIFGIGSMRRTCKEIQVNLAYRWFLGISMDESVPNYSTWSQNYIRRYGDSQVFEQIFDQILKQAIDYGFVDMETVFGDSTHQKANANKNKYTDEEVEIAKKVYEDELLKEINKDREKHGKKPLKKTEQEELNYDEETGKLKKDVETKHLGGRALPRRALGPAPLWAATPPRAALPAAGCPISSQSFSSPKPLSSTQGRAPGTSFILQLSPNPAAMSIPPRQAFLPEHGKQNLPISRPGLHYVK